MSESIWQKNSLVTHIFFDLCLFQHFSPVANFVQQSIGMVIVIKDETIFECAFDPRTSPLLYNSMKGGWYEEIKRSRLFLYE